MLIPIGQENSEVRRNPWVSYAVIAFNLLVFLAMAVVYDEDALFARLAEQWREIAVYLSEHPYLVPPPEVGRFLDPEDVEALERLRAEHAGSVEPEVLESEQAHLDALDARFAAAREESPVRRLGFRPARGGALTMMTSMFVHAGWMHILGNMLFFFLSGPFVEDVFGRPLFAFLYLASGCVGTLAHAWKFPESDIPSVGASGAIAGVMGAFLVRLGASRIHFLYMPLFPVVWTLRFTFFVPAFVVLPLWFGEQVLYAHATGEESGVGFWAHIGGFVFGGLAAAAVRVLGVEQHLINPAIEKQITLEQHPSLEAAIDARTRGEHARARIEIRKVLSAEPENLDAWIESYEIALAAGDAAETGRSATRLLELYVRHGERELAHDHIADAGQRAGGLPPRFHMAAAGFLEKEGDARAALDLYERVATEHPTDPSALRALFRRAEILARGGDLRAAREAIGRARAHPAWNEQMQGAADRLLEGSPR